MKWWSKLTLVGLETPGFCWIFTWELAQIRPEIGKSGPLYLDLKKLGAKVGAWAKATPENSRLDTQNDGLEKVTPFKHGNFWYQFVRFLWCNYNLIFSLVNAWAVNKNFG